MRGYKITITHFNDRGNPECQRSQMFKKRDEALLEMSRLYASYAEYYQYESEHMIEFYRNMPVPDAETFGFELGAPYWSDSRKTSLVISER